MSHGGPYTSSRGHGEITGWLAREHPALVSQGLATGREERWVSPAALSEGSSPRARARRPAADVPTVRRALQITGEDGALSDCTYAATR